MTNEAKIALIIVFCCCCCIFFLIYGELKKSEKSAELSCLGSIHTATLGAVKSGQIKSVGNSRELAKDEIDGLIKQGKIGDCGGKEYIFENIHIAIGDVNKKSSLQIRVWANGDDKISGTTDDVIFPYEENADQNKPD